MAQVQGVPEERLALLRQWCTDTQYLMAKAEEDARRKAMEQQAAQSMMGPGGPPPGGPGGPPPMGPMGPGGPPPGGDAKPIDVQAPPTMMAPGGALAA
jgi:hypothetical protein